jgi:methionyl aminopeptidase
MIAKKDASALAALREGGRRLSAILAAVAQAARPGVSTAELDKLARTLVAAGGDEPAFLNYRPAGVLRPYPAALCASVNDEVVHGIPGERRLAAGDIISLDLGLKHAGLFTDMAFTISVGDPKPAVKRLLQAGRQALEAGIAELKPGARVGDVGAAISASAKRQGYAVVRELGGHGVGYKIHEEPLVPNHGRRGRGERLEAGMVLAIEPMLAVGRPEVVYDDDDYTVRTADGQLAVHFEQTVAVTEGGFEILTPFPPRWL